MRAVLYLEYLEVDMYGLLVELTDGEQRFAEVGEALEPVGFERLIDGVYICTKPRRTELLVVHDAIEALHKLPWFAAMATRVVAFKVDEMGDITGAIKRGE